MIAEDMARTPMDEAPKTADIDDCTGDCPPECEREEAVRARRQAFVNAARAAFFEKGYAGTTMSSIAAAVGGSKTTLWSYFPSKEDLFTAVADDLAAEYCEALVMDMPADGDPAIVLRQFGKALLRTLLSEPVLAMQRLVIAEAERFPNLSKTFFERAPKQGRARLSAFLSAAMERGALRDGDPLFAAKQFKALVSNNLVQARLYCEVLSVSAEQIEEDVEMALDAFLRLWAPE